MCSEMLIGHSLTSKSALALASFLPHACRSLNFLCPQRKTFHSKTAIMKPAFVHVQCIAKSILTSNLHTTDLSTTLLISTQAHPINVDLSQYSHVLLICYSTCTECLFWVKPNHHWTVFRFLALAGKNLSISIFMLRTSKITCIEAVAVACMRLKSGGISTYPTRLG